jgi:EAL domain-containing protein (putative c-di-GMP-specific phosphodiesterase class I)/GGDEF domain-containing protein
MTHLLEQTGRAVAAAGSATQGSSLIPLGMMSRTELTEELERRLFEAAEARRPFALLWLTVVQSGRPGRDGEHAPSKSLLRHCAERIAARLATRDVMAYLGDGDFAVLVGSLREPGDAIAFARNLLDAFQRPFLDGTRPLYAEVNLGVAVHPTDGDLPVRLLRAAQGAAHRAAQQLPARRARLAFSSDSLNQQQRRAEQIRIGLQDALSREEFALHYQPMLHLPEDRVAAVEALIRWDSADLGRVPPDEFIPTAERSGEIVSIGKWVLSEACRQAREWELGGMPVRVAVNLSARQLHEPDLTDFVSGVLEETGLTPVLLELELTESMYAEPETAVTVLKRLHEIGVRVAIDDFGTGFSSLAYLARLPRDTLKIDRSFISLTTKDTDVAAVVGSVIVMAHALGVQTVAEGVETDDHLSFLLDHKCDLSQGYLHSPPLPAVEIEGWLRSYDERRGATPSVEVVGAAARDRIGGAPTGVPANGNGAPANGNGTAPSNGNAAVAKQNANGAVHINGNRNGNGGARGNDDGNGGGNGNGAIHVNGKDASAALMSGDGNGLAHVDANGAHGAGQNGNRKHVAGGGHASAGEQP